MIPYSNQFPDVEPVGTARRVETTVGLTDSDCRVTLIAMKLLPLSKGKFTMVDDADFLWLRRFRWHYSATTGYARTHLGHGVFRNLHQLLLPRITDKVADHINRDKLDNRRCNLRLVTKAENNRNKLQHNNTSGFSGVTRNVNSPSRWIAQASLNNQNYYIGSYGSPEEAAKARTAFLEKFLTDPYSIPPKGPLKRNNRSGFNGVFWFARKQRWIAHVYDKQGKRRYAGSGRTPNEAAQRLAEFKEREGL